MADAWQCGTANVNLAIIQVHFLPPTSVDERFRKVLLKLHGKISLLLGEPFCHSYHRLNKEFTSDDLPSFTRPTQPITMTTLLDLPDEVLIDIATHIDILDIAALRKVCQAILSPT